MIAQMATALPVHGRPSSPLFDSERGDELAEIWQAGGLDVEDVISWAELKAVLGRGGIDASAAEQLSVLPGSLGGRVAARALYLDEVTFEACCRIVGALEKDHDGGMCELCGSTWSKIAGWHHYECRFNNDGNDHDLCYVFAGGASLPQGAHPDELISEAQMREGVAAVLAQSGRSRKVEEVVRAVRPRLPLRHERWRVSLVQEELIDYFLGGDGLLVQ